MINRKVFVILGMAALVATGVLGSEYYIFFRQGLTKTQGTPAFSVGPTTQPTRKIGFPLTPQSSASGQRANVSQSALNRGTVARLLEMREGILVSSVATSEFVGKIISFDLKEGTTSTQFTYALQIKLANSQGQSNTFWFSKESLSKITLTSQDPSGNEHSITLRNIATGDSIHMVLVQDLISKDHSLVSAKIIKIIP